MENSYIVSACRTPIGSFRGSLKNVAAVKLGAICIEESLRRGCVSGNLVDEVIMGNVLQAGLGQNPARQAAIFGGIPYEVEATTINKVCGSGLKSVSLGAQAIASGYADCVVCGGMENMSSSAYLIKNYRDEVKMGDQKLVDSMITDGLWDVFNNYHMGITAENIAEKYNISKEEQDEFAFNSQVKANKALADNLFVDEIVNVKIETKKENFVFSEDEYIRKNIVLDKIKSLPSAFKKDGTVSAANASGLNDGAAAVVIVSEKFLVANGLKPLAKIISCGSRGVDPAFMGLGPIPTINYILKKANMAISDIDVFEINEAFAAQSIAVINELKIDVSKVNLNGGAIALGHPIGASGCRILTTLLYNMKRLNKQFGLASLCVGGGMGEGVIVELC